MYLVTLLLETSFDLILRTVLLAAANLSPNIPSFFGAASSAVGSDVIVPVINFSCVFKLVESVAALGV